MKQEKLHPTRMTYENLMSKMEPNDLIGYGLIPEFMGRVPVLAVLTALDKHALVEALHKPKNSLVRQYKELFALSKVSLQFTDAALEEIALQAIKRKTGARGLRSIMEHLLLPAMYELPNPEVKVVKIDEEVVRQIKKPILIKGDNQISE